MPQTSWPRDWTVGVRVWVDRHGATVLGKGRAELLDAIDQRRSITAAAKAVGLSYRKAWMVVQEVNAAAGRPLVEAAVGGRDGGGARLTEQGRLAVDVYWRLHSALERGAGRTLRQLAAPSDRAGAPLRVAAAISLQEALSQILAAFGLRRPDVRVRAVYGASNELADQLLAGAPGSLFISADRRTVEQLSGAGMLADGTRRVIAVNGLAVIGPRGLRVRRLADLLARPKLRVALADPACPLGRYTQDYLESVRALETLRPRALYVDNSRAVASAVASGAADVGIAFSSDAAALRPSGVLFRVPAARVGVEYEAAMLAGDDQDERTGALLEFLSSPAARRCLRRCGFRAPPAGCRRTAAPSARHR